MKINTSSALKIILLFITLGASLIEVFHPSGFSLPKLAIVTLFIISINLILIFFYKNLYQFENIQFYFQVIFILLIIWTLFTIARSLDTNSKDLITLFTHMRVGGLSWLPPLAIIFGLNIKNWLIIFKFIPKILFFGIILSIISLIISIDFGTKVWLSFFPVMLLTYLYHPKSTQRIILLSVLMYILISILTSQRANAIFIALMIVFFIGEYLRDKDISIYKKVSLFLISSVIVLFGVLAMNALINDVKQDKEASADTRTFLFVELFADMSDNEMIIGKGALGTYYSPYFAEIRSEGMGGDSSTRATNEVGYLFILLKGGIIMIVLYLLILIPVAYLGIFKSDNIITRMCGYYILTYLLLWMVSFPQEFLPKFIILWMAVGTIISDSNRKLQNNDLMILENERKIFASY